MMRMMSLWKTNTMMKRVASRATKKKCSMMKVRSRMTCQRTQRSLREDNKYKTAREKTTRKTTSTWLCLSWRRIKSRSRNSTRSAFPPKLRRPSLSECRRRSLINSCIREYSCRKCSQEQTDSREVGSSRDLLRRARKLMLALKTASEK